MNRITLSRLSVVCFIFIAFIVWGGLVNGEDGVPEKSAPPTSVEEKTIVREDVPEPDTPAVPEKDDKVALPEEPQVVRDVQKPKKSDHGFPLKGRGVATLSVSFVPCAIARIGDEITDEFAIVPDGQGLKAGVKRDRRGIINYLYKPDENCSYLGMAFTGPESLAGMEKAGRIKMRCDGRDVTDITVKKFFYKADEGLKVAIVFDRSMCLNKRMADLKGVARDICRSLDKKNDIVGVWGAGYEEKPQSLVPLDRAGNENIRDMIRTQFDFVDVKELEGADLDDDMSTRTLDAMAFAVDELVMGSKFRRKILVALGRFDDNASTTTLENLIKKCQENRVQVYILYDPDPDENSRDGISEDYRRVLARLDYLAKQTGGLCEEAADRRDGYRERLEDMTAPDISVLARLPLSALPADGAQHMFQVIFSDPKGKVLNDKIKARVVTVYKNRMTVVVSVMQIVIPVLLGFVILLSVIVFAISRNREANLELEEDVAIDGNGAELAELPEEKPGEPDQDAEQA